MAAAAVALGPLLKSGAQESAGILRSIISALEKPIYTDVVTTQTSKVNKDGIVVTTTHTKGWSIPLGIPVLIVGSIVAWEIGLSVSKALSGWNGGSAIVQGAEDLMNVATWPVSTAIGGLASLASDVGSAVSTGKLLPGPSSSASSREVAIPPTFMAHLSLVGQQALTPATAGLQMLFNKIGIPSPGS